MSRDLFEPERRSCSKRLARPRSWAGLLLRTYYCISLMHCSILLKGVLVAEMKLQQNKYNIYDDDERLETLEISINTYHSDLPFRKEHMTVYRISK